MRVVSVDHLFLISFMNTLSGESTAASILTFPFKIDLDSRSVPYTTLELFSPVPATALLVLQELLTPDLLVCNGGSYTTVR